jgi:hypothetical protein
MRRLLPFAALTLALGLPAHAVAQEADAVPATPEARIEALQQRLLASQQTIATLERELADEKNRAVALDRCRVKNGRLVRIGRQLVEGYMARYRQTHKDPFQLGRRRFEFEMQALSEAVYDAQSLVPEKDAPAAAPADGATPDTASPATAPAQTPPAAQQP